ncbi:MAG: type III pantothenate kinase [Myxococcales bacterium]|nr:type III pantothenate kinase [Myxococcales bacterium]
MLLAIDTGNTNTVLGVFDGERLLRHWRIATSEDRTSDEYAIALRQLFELAALSPELEAAIISSVVPGAVAPLRRCCEQHFGVETLVVGPGIKSGMPILAENPKEVGADRIVNGVAAFERFGRAEQDLGLIVVDFGTATTLDCISPRGEYLGGAICPGVTISADALYHHAAKLPRVEVQRPPSVVGRNTVHCLQVGIYYGYAAMVDGLVTRMKEELGFAVRVIATGGLATLIGEASTTIDEVDDLLTLEGLRLIYRRNRAA